MTIPVFGRMSVFDGGLVPNLHQRLANTLLTHILKGVIFSFPSPNFLRLCMDTFSWVFYSTPFQHVKVLWHILFFCCECCSCLRYLDDGVRRLCHPVGARGTVPQSGHLLASGSQGVQCHRPVQKTPPV